jgi:hypothetical protein
VSSCKDCGAGTVSLETVSHGKVTLHASPACAGFTKQSRRAGRECSLTMQFVGYVRSQRVAPAEHVKPARIIQRARPLADREGTIDDPAGAPAWSEEGDR